MSDLLDRLRAAMLVLEDIGHDWSVLDELPAEDRARLHRAVAHLYQPDAVARRKRLKEAERDRATARRRKDDESLAETGIRELRRRPVFTTPNVFAPVGKDDPHDQDVQDGPAAPPRVAADARICYVCKQPYTELHHFYDQMCPPCAALNYAKRTERADLSGRVALLTGGRVKIGYQAGLKLLRCGAHLIVTTRFPRDAAMRYAQEPDFADWGHRIEVFGLDLRHTPSVEAFCRELVATRPRLDFILNNACQTVRRPPDFYRHMMAAETSSVRTMPDHARVLLGSFHDESAGALDVRGTEVAGLMNAAQLSQVALLPEDVTHSHLFPEGHLDQDLQQVDLRGRNSWRLLLAEVSSVEFLEVQLVNAVAPFIFNARLKPLMLRTENRDKHIVNVSAVEGQFYRVAKTTRHPHTNMAKAALNMMTRTSATDYYGDGIHMNSVDTGWVTDEDPEAIAARKVADQRFHPPLDIVDGGARIVDPIISGVNTGIHVWGRFLKDYHPTDW